MEEVGKEWKKTYLISRLSESNEQDFISSIDTKARSKQRKEGMREEGIEKGNK